MTRYGFLIAINLMLILMAALLFFWKTKPTKNPVELVVMEEGSHHGGIVVALTLLRKKGYRREDVETLRWNDPPQKNLLQKVFPNAYRRHTHTTNNKQQKRIIRANPRDISHHALSFPVDDWSSLFFSNTLRARQQRMTVVVLDCGERQHNVLAIVERCGLRVVPKESIASADCVIGTTLDEQMYMKPGGVVIELTENNTPSLYHAMAIAMRHFYLVFYQGRLSHPILMHQNQKQHCIDGQFEDQLHQVFQYLQTMYV
jgi:hypothetical protein